MCGRYIQTHDLAAVSRRFNVAEASVPVRRRFNIAPTQEVAVIVMEGGRRVMRMMRWGLVPRWADSPLIGGNLINARAETVATKPAFREALRLRRCLVPSDGFYEWRKDGGGKKTPMCIRLRDRAMFGYAGIWERWTGQDGKTLDTCAIITVAANALVAAAHDRMPAIVRAEDEAAWLDPGVTDAEAILPLLGPLDERLMEMYAVSRAVNKPEADEASMIEAVDEGPDVQGQLF